MKLIQRQKGFTIVELMIATAAFSIILLLATGSIMEIGKLYYKALTQSKTQETARNISEEVTRSIQFSKFSKEVPDPTRNQFCIGDTRYTYEFNQKIDPADTSRIGIKASRISSADSCATPGAPGKELLGKNMQLLDFVVEPVANSSGKVYEIHLRIAYADNDLLTAYDNNGNLVPGANTKTALCKSNVAGSNFCAVSHLDNFVKKRLQ